MTDLSLIRSILEDKLGKLDADIRAHQDTLASIMAERRGILFALDTMDKAEKPAADAPAPEPVKRRGRRSRAEIEAAEKRAAEAAVADGLVPTRTVILPDDKFSDVPPIPENLKRTA